LNHVSGRFDQLDIAARARPAARPIVRVCQRRHITEDRQHRFFDKQAIGVRFVRDVLKDHALPQIAVGVARTVREGKRRVRTIDRRRFECRQRIGDRFRRHRKPLALIAARAQLAAPEGLARVVVGHRVGVGDERFAAVVRDPHALAREHEERL
jgi:hypothetical protein